MRQFIKCIFLLMIFSFLTETIIFPENAEAQNSDFSQFLGSWVGSGELFGQDTQFEMEWEQTLNNQFIQLTFQSRYKDPDGNLRMFVAKAFYHNYEDNQINGTWYD